MATASKVSRKQLLNEPDSFQMANSRFMERLLVNKIPLAILLILIVLAAAGLGFYQKQLTEKDMAQEHLLFEMKQEWDKAEDKSSSSLLSTLKTKYEKIEQDSQKKRALLFLADSYFQAKNFGEAEKLYTESNASAGQGTLIKDLARLGLAHVLEAKKDYSKANEAYKSIIDSPGPLPVFYVYLDLARSYEESGDKQNAALILRDLEAKFPSHSDLEIVKKELKRLEAGSK